MQLTRFCKVADLVRSHPGLRCAFFCLALCVTFVLSRQPRIASRRHRQCGGCGRPHQGPDGTRDQPARHRGKIPQRPRFVADHSQAEWLRRHHTDYCGPGAGVAWKPGASRRHRARSVAHRDPEGQRGRCAAVCADPDQGRDRFPRPGDGGEQERRLPAEYRAVGEVDQQRRRGAYDQRGQARRRGGGAAERPPGLGRGPEDQREQLERTRSRRCAQRAGEAAHAVGLDRAGGVPRRRADCASIPIRKR